MFQRKALLLSNLPERGRKRRKGNKGRKREWRQRHEIFVFVALITKFILPEKSLIKRIIP